MYSYRIYSLTLQSPHRLPLLTPHALSAPADLTLCLTLDDRTLLTQTHPPSWHTHAQPDGLNHRLFLRAPCQALLANIDPTAQHIHISAADFSLDEVTAILLGTILGVTLRLRGILCLHSSVLAVQDRAIAFLGVKGAGKSTTAAALAQLGTPVLADDVAVLRPQEAGFQVQPGYPRLRLWKSAVNALYGSEAELPRVFQPLEKHFLPLSSKGDGDAEAPWQFHPHPLPLTAIYLLDARDPSLAIPKVTPMAPTLAVMHLLGHRYPQSFQPNPAQQAHEFAAIAQLAGTVPIRQVHRPDTLDALPALCDTILKDVSQLKPS